MKILHLTDLHIGAKANDTPDMRKRIDFLIRKLTIDRHSVPHLADISPTDLPVVITGDLVDRGIDVGAFSLAKEIFITPLRNEGYPLFLVPGNHDYGTGSAANRTTEAEFHKVFKDEVFARESNNYPVLRWVNDVALIGLNSMEEEVDDDDDGDARGRLGGNQLNLLKSILSRPNVKNATKRVVYLHHHPFFKGFIKKHWMALDDTKELQEILKNQQIDLLLFGHKHEGKTWHGQIGIAKVYDGGTSTGHKNNLSPHRLIDLKTDQPEFDIDLNLLADYQGNRA
ncbi:metallophosphoesterase family protein [Methylomonas sp. 2BW1-5-20]|uniref:metallophosphoesterase family protein n=1 Tax=Methylomonas sp. 2BW1-5-20 TaxID=3376686 RepID=UPI00405015E6